MFAFSIALAILLVCTVIVVSWMSRAPRIEEEEQDQIDFRSSPFTFLDAPQRRRRLSIHFAQKTVRFRRNDERPLLKSHSLYRRGVSLIHDVFWAKRADPSGSLGQQSKIFHGDRVDPQQQVDGRV